MIYICHWYLVGKGHPYLGPALCSARAFAINRTLSVTERSTPASTCNCRDISLISTLHHWSGGQYNLPSSYLDVNNIPHLPTLSRIQCNSVRQRDLNLQREHQCYHENDCTHLACDSSNDLSQWKLILNFDTDWTLRVDIWWATWEGTKRGQKCPPFSCRAPGCIFVTRLWYTWAWWSKSIP